MSAIAVKQEQYTIYVLTDEAAQSVVEVIPERGGIITRWQIQGQEVFYLDTERLTNPELTVRGGNPILFPICGNLPDNTYVHNGQTYTLKQHGFARDLPWVVTHQNEGECSLTVALTSTEQTRASYPFDFEVAFTYRLLGSTLEVHQQFTNTSAEPMPFSIGFHPYFLATDKTQLQVDIPGTEFWNHREQKTEPFAGSFDFDRDEIDAAFLNITRQSASVTDLSRQMRLTLDYDPQFSTLIFWTVKGKDFYCLEPWSAPRNAMNTGNHLITLEPGANLETSFRMTVAFI